MKKLISSVLWCLWFCLLCSTLVLGEDTEAGPPIRRLQAVKSDTARVSLLVNESNKLSAQEPRKAMEYALDGLHLAKQTKSPQHLKVALLAAFRASFLSGLFIESAKFAGEYLKIVEAEGNALELAIAYNNLGAIKFAMNLNSYDASVESLFLKSLGYYQKYCRISQDSTQSINLVNLYVNLAILRRLKQDFPLAEKYIQQGLELAENNPRQIAQYLRLLINYGDLLTTQMKYPEALSYLNKGLHVSAESTDKVMEAAFHFSLGSLYEKRRDTARVLEHMLRFYEMSLLQNNPSTIYIAADKLSSIYESLGDSDQTLKYLQIARKNEEKMALIRANEEVIRAEMASNIRDIEKKMDAKLAKRTFKLLMLAGGIFLVVLGLFALYFTTRKRYKLAKLSSIEKELSAQKLELEKALLESELESKDKAFTAEAIGKIQRNELISGVVSRLLDLNNTQTQSDQKEVIGRVVRDLRKTMENNIWEEFESRFHQMNSGFFQKLQGINPGLTPNERRLCAFLSLNMSSKEISAITGQSPESLKKARMRLRKKLNLTNSDTNLVSFLSTL
jgi:hypothetical protein